MSRLKEIETIKSKVDMFDFKGVFEESCFGFLLRMYKIEFIGLLIHRILMKQDRNQRSKELRDHS